MHAQAPCRESFRSTEKLLMSDLCSPRILNLMQIGKDVQFGKVPRHLKHIHTSIEKNLYFSKSVLSFNLKVGPLVSQMMRLSGDDIKMHRILNIVLEIIIFCILWMNCGMFLFHWGFFQTWFVRIVFSYFIAPFSDSVCRNSIQFIF